MKDRLQFLTYTIINPQYLTNVAYDSRTFGFNLKGSSGNSFIRLCDVLDRSDSRRACWDMQSGCGGGAAEASAQWRHT